jgi:hypothetical protein
MEKVPFGKFGFIHRSASDWMQSHLNSIIAAGVGVLAVASWTVYQWNTGSPGDYISAEKAFNELASEGPSARKETLQSFTQNMTAALRSTSCSAAIKG